MKNYTKKGISLIALVITIIVIAILASVVLLTLYNTNVFDQSKKATFMNDFRTVQDAVNIYSLSNYNKITKSFELPLKGNLTVEDKEYIKSNIPTLNTKITELSGNIDEINLVWIDHELLDLKLANKKQDTGYLIDKDNGQIYDYIGEYFEGKMWHTLDAGVISSGPGSGNDGSQIIEEIWDGWIKLTLYYPSNSNERKWRLGTEGEMRVDPILMWQNYTGPITIPLDRVKDVWIKYKIDGNEVIVPPAGTLLVDIVPDKTGYTKVPGVNVKINYDKDATVKEYRVGDSGWITYNGVFQVTENCIIEARAKKTETIYNEDGSILTKRDIAGRDLVYIGNIGVEEMELEPPTIARLPGVGEEKAMVQVTYPDNAARKVYKINYGVEEEYISEIPVMNYGTHIIAYYYDSNGKRSKAVSIRINDTSRGNLPEEPQTYIPGMPHEPGSPNPPYNPGDYGINIPAPNINVDPTSLTEEVEVSVSAPANADRLYIKLGRYGSYVEYTSPIKVRQNTQVYAYYRTYAGERSNTGSRLISNIKQRNKPYLSIDANPYPWSYSYGASQVTVVVNYSEADTVEYSEDGIIFKPYTSPFIIKENKTIYARATNTYGTTEDSLNITNIGKLSPPVPRKNLAVSINVDPEPLLSNNRVTKATVSIEYDDDAKEKYYSIGKYGTLQTYNDKFEVTSNCTIYAYAKGENAKGTTYKIIDNLTTGISDPIITGIPSDTHSSKSTIDISYDKYATVKRYSIDGGALRDYGGQFDVTHNCTIYAYSQNEFGHISESSYTVTNIVPQPPVAVIDKGKYYILKLNYPPESENREYKWKENGEWKTYKEAGILLLKPQYKDQLLQNGVLVKVEDENGNLITFTGDYYFIDVSISELVENLFMRWDRQPLGAPQILIEPTEPSLNVNATIVYNNALITKQYKVINPDGTTDGWQEYTNPIYIDKNNTIIYARGMDDTEVWTKETVKKITNIDEIQPVIKLTADLDTAMQKVSVKISVTDDVAVGKVKWASGIQGESYFSASGTEVANNSIVSITENGYYTFYAEDRVGNKQVYTLNITNVDNIPPAIDIQVVPDDTLSLYANVTINYGDSTTRQYKVGTNNSVWSNYTDVFEISSYTILSNNWQNADGTVTIYAKGKDSSGNETIIQKKVVNLDLDKPSLPVITSNAGYPVLYEYGVNLDTKTTILYDNRTDIDNYYSIDAGTTWIPYTGTFDYPSGTIIAKSVKKESGLETVVSKTISMPSNALRPASYDGDYNTNSSGGIIKVSPNLYGSTVIFKESAGGQITLHFRNASGTSLQSWTSSNNYQTHTLTFKIPEGTDYIQFPGGMAIWEIDVYDEPVITAVNGYMLLHSDIYKAIHNPYQMITINYFPTSIQRLYKIGDGETWLNYNDQPIKVEQGETIYSKGIDKYGNETRVISSHTVNVTNGLKKEAYDGTSSTSTGTGGNIKISPELHGKQILIHETAGGQRVIYFRNSSGASLQSWTSTSTTQTHTLTFTIPDGTDYIQIPSGMTVYEITIKNEPTFTATNTIMLLHPDPLKQITSPYQSIIINYFPTSVQRLYKIGDSEEWLSYNDEVMTINEGEIINAKGIDKYGNETRITSIHTVTVSGALKKEACDGDSTTYASGGGNIKVSSELYGKQILIHERAGGQKRIWFRNSSGGVLHTWTSSNSTQTHVLTFTVPQNTDYIQIENGMIVYEISVKQ